MKNKQPKGLLPGIYMNLSNDRYHADPALGHSGIPKLIRSPMEYWLASSLNPDREEKTNDWFQWGKDLEMLLLEPAAFRNTYTIQPREALDIDKKIMSNYDYDALKQAVGVINGLKKAKQMLAGGYAQVSIFWRDKETGIMLKTRHDQFKPMYTVDVKTSRDIGAQRLFWDSKKYGYNIQDAMYRISRQEARTLLNAGQMPIHGKIDPIFKMDFMESEEDNFIFLYTLSKAPFPARLIVLRPDFVLDGAADMREGIEIYNMCMKKYGPDKCWPATLNDNIEEIGY
ncbi:MAG: PD-(D/E)XK nuclease-like domain-containing protein [Candidatus Anammoxibacter sp.]